MSIPQPERDWKLEPDKPGRVNAWINRKGYSNFLSKGELIERSKKRGLARMHEIKAKLKNKS